MTGGRSAEGPLAKRCPTCGQPLGLECRVRRWAAEVRAITAHAQAEQEAALAPYRTARYRRWRWPVALTVLGLAFEAGIAAMQPWGWLALVAVFGWAIWAATWLMSGARTA